MSEIQTTEQPEQMYSLKPCIAELERFYTFLNLRFKLQLPNKAIITIQSKGRKSAYGWFWCGMWDNHKEKGINEINISAEYLTDNNPYKTMAHEIAHFQELIKNGKLSKNNYHTKDFKDFAEKLLLKVDKMEKFGYALTTPTDEFNKMLEEEFKPNKAVFDVVRLTQDVKQKQPTKMKKYSCACGINVRCAVELNAVCEVCNTKFERCE